MPFTPIHVGPGILIKAALQGSFSLMIFGWSQILIDIQPLVVMLTGKGELHGFTHTFAFATVIAVVAALTGKHLSEWFLRKVDIPLLKISPRITWPVAIVSALLGTYSHILLDSIMHTDMEPFYPVVTDNPFYGIVSVPMLHNLCVASGILGAVVYVLISRLSGGQKK